jgi:penicillin-binding protein 2
MIDPASERRAPISPQLALRVAVLGVAAFILFGIIFFRLWYLQVLSGDQYLRQAQTNRVRLERIPAPRGAIVDRDGNPLVKNRQATVIKIDPEKLPEQERTDALTWGQSVTERSRRPKGRQGPPIPIPKALPEVAKRFKRLSRVIGISAATIQERVVTGLAQVPYSPVTIRSKVPATLRDYLEERNHDFKGVTVEPSYLRTYPHGTLAAQLLGSVGEITPKELKMKAFRGVKQGTVVGQQGLEATYDRYLRGRDGADRFFVDAQGQRKGRGQARDPQPGRQVQLSLSTSLQKAGELAMLRAGGGKPGGFVAMDPRDGEILAMGSYPTYDPRVLIPPVSKRDYERLTAQTSGSPLTNRAISGTYATGSTFKPITALAALSAGIVTPGSVIDDAGCTTIGIGPGSERCNAGKEANGPVNLVSALRVSSDVYFYKMGQFLYSKPGQVLQTWARRLGFGHRSGVDLPAEIKGNVPDAKWRDRINKAEADCRKEKHHPCGIADGTNRPYSVGDNVSLAIGQGDLLATPLQMAVAYAAIENGGKIVRPHLGVRVEDDQGRLITKLNRPPAKTIKFDPTALAAIREGLHEAASAPGGTSTQVFQGWNQARFPVYGKTGTAQKNGQFDQSWYVCWVPDAKRPIVVAMTIEQGGFGAEAAAPAVRQILSQWFYGKTGKFVVGQDRTF